ncbi:MAG: iron ABC transporter permease [Bacteroidetes bacterium]|nr:iron ABC transporter permease [Bacteroidota bacterium]
MITASIIILILLFVWAISVGTANIPIGDVFGVLLGKLLPFTGLSFSEDTESIVMELRLPRILMAIASGMGFAVSGTAMQGITRNPLVSPFTIGISSAAAFGASLAIVLGVSILGTASLIVIGNAFVFAVLAALLVYGIASIRGARPETLILAGIAIMYLFSALTSLLQYIADTNRLQEVIHWLFGSLSEAGWGNIPVITIILIAGFILLMKLSWDLNTLSEGDETAISLGVNPGKVRVTVILTATLITSSIVCFTGIIGFICLAGPHIARMLAGNDHRYLLPFSAIVGAILLLLADTAGRIIIQPVEIPVGIVTSFVGVPLFVYLLIKKRKSYW